MTRYVERMIGRRVFACRDALACPYDYQRNIGENGLSKERIVDARTQHYQGKLVDAMLKILYLERFNVKQGKQSLMKS